MDQPLEVSMDVVSCERLKEFSIISFYSTFLNQHNPSQDPRSIASLVGGEEKSLLCGRKLWEQKLRVEKDEVVEEWLEYFSAIRS